MTGKGYNNSECQGDLLIEIKVRLPDLSDDQIKALKNVVQPQ